MKRTIAIILLAAALVVGIGIAVSYRKRQPGQSCGVFRGRCSVANSCVDNKCQGMGFRETSTSSILGSWLVTDSRDGSKEVVQIREGASCDKNPDYCPLPPDVASQYPNAMKFHVFINDGMDRVNGYDARLYNGPIQLYYPYKERVTLTFRAENTIHAIDPASGTLLATFVRL